MIGRAKPARLMRQTKLEARRSDVSEVPIGVVTVSDRAAAGIYEDKGGPGIEAALAAILATPWRPCRRLVPDERGTIAAALRDLADVRALLADPGHRRHRPEPARRDAGGDGRLSATGSCPASAS